MSERLLVAVDGGNSKTDAVLLRGDGRVLAAVRGPGSNPDHIGTGGTVDILELLIEAAWRESGLEPAVARPMMAVGAFFLAGADQPSEEAALHALISARGWADHVLVANDALALLWAGSSEGWGVAVVVGAGINCVGRSASGATARFAALGLVTGDWGGGYDIGMAALGAAIRGEDGRGEPTALSGAIAAHFSLASALEVGLSIHGGRIAYARVSELPRTVFALAVDGDSEARAIVDRQADEVSRFAGAALRRMGHTDDDVEVVLGGSVMTAAPARLLDRVRAGIGVDAPRAQVMLCSRRPLVGAAVAALHLVGADDAARDRVREELIEERIVVLPAGAGGAGR